MDLLRGSCLLVAPGPAHDKGVKLPQLPEKQEKEPTNQPTEPPSYPEFFCEDTLDGGCVIKCVIKQGAFSKVLSHRLLTSNHQFLPNSAKFPCFLEAEAFPSCSSSVPQGIVGSDSSERQHIPNNEKVNCFLRQKILCSDLLPYLGK